MTKQNCPDSQAMADTTAVSSTPLRFQRPCLSPDDKKALLAEYVAYYEQVLNEQGLQALNVKAPRAVFVPILDKIEALIHAEVDAICSQQSHEIHTFLNENPLPDCLNTLLPKEFRVYSLLLNALKQWVAAKSADTDKFLLGGRAREYCRDAAECCIVTKVPLCDESRVELHHPMRNGRPSLPLSKHGHSIVENQTPRCVVRSEKNLQAEDFASPCEHICWLRKERYQSWAQLQ